MLFCTPSVALQSKAEAGTKRDARPLGKPAFANVHAVPCEFSRLERSPVALLGVSSAVIFCVCMGLMWPLWLQWLNSKHRLSTLFRGIVLPSCDCASATGIVGIARKPSRFRVDFQRADSVSLALSRSHSRLLVHSLLVSLCEGRAAPWKQRIYRLQGWGLASAWHWIGDRIESQGGWKTSPSESSARSARHRSRHELPHAVGEFLRQGCSAAGKCCATRHEPSAAAM